MDSSLVQSPGYPEGHRLVLSINGVWCSVPCGTTVAALSREFGIVWDDYRFHEFKPVVLAPWVSWAPGLTELLRAGQEVAFIPAEMDCREFQRLDTHDLGLLDLGPPRVQATMCRILRFLNSQCD